MASFSLYGEGKGGCQRAGRKGYIEKHGRGLCALSCNSPERGPVAQLGARFHGMEEVVSSNLTRSTKNISDTYSPLPHPPPRIYKLYSRLVELGRDGRDARP